MSLNWETLGILKTPKMKIDLPLLCGSLKKVKAMMSKIWIKEPERLCWHMMLHSKHSIETRNAPGERDGSSQESLEENWTKHIPIWINLLPSSAGQEAMWHASAASIAAPMHAVPQLNSIE